MGAVAFTVIIFIAGSGNSMELVHTIKVPNDRRCIQLVKEINADRSNPYIAACYADVRVRGS